VSAGTAESPGVAPGEWLATCARGLAPILCRELQMLGAENVSEEAAAVRFSGSRATLYRACLWSRTASRILLPIGGGGAADADALYRLVLELPWHRLLADGASIAVDFHGTNAAIRDSRFGARRTKDGIVDQLRAAGLARPEVDPRAADLRIVLRLQGDRADVALDLSGDSLHRRGYRRGTGAAPMKETLAAAMLLRADWPELAARGDALIDPLCGAATLLIEGAFMAADRAPGLDRERYGFRGWRDHDPAQWAAIVADARARASRGLASELPEIRGYDEDPRVIRRAEENIAAAGLSRQVRVAVKSLRQLRRPTHRPLERGLVVCNPPYGERLGRGADLAPLYRHLGELMSREFRGWKAAILTGDRELGRATGLRSHRQYALFNGRLPVTLLLFDLDVENRLRDAPTTADAGRTAPAAEPGGALASPLSDGALMFANRLRKNQRRLQRWLKRENISCYRLYDADMPEYAVAVDRYGDRLHVAEYRAPASVDAQAAAARLDEVRAALPQATGVPAERIVFKTRERQRGAAQYDRHAARGEELEVREGDCRFYVNLTDYLDTGLFLDHRPLRLRIGREARGKRFLNLFCYTGTATVHAAVGGAAATTSVDLSNTYLAWLRRNLALNGLGESRHRFERADCPRWLREGEERYDIVLLDPPSFSNSARMADSFDVQRDHATLIGAAMERLEPGGWLYFSTNRRRFRLDPGLAERFHCEDITEATLDVDFPRRPAPHRCWRLQW
jgi:23S rRNA (guanine2445-N2)-methyltransferase / 23S rRNA (guanine2069-N7)-methyltransferase